MLVLSRKVGETIIIDGKIKITVSSIRGKQVKLVIDAPPDIIVHREEVYERIVEANKKAMCASSIEVKKAIEVMKDNKIRG